MPSKYQVISQFQKRGRHVLCVGSGNVLSKLDNGVEEHFIFCKDDPDDPPQHPVLRTNLQTAESAVRFFSQFINQDVHYAVRGVLSIEEVE